MTRWATTENTPVLLLTGYDTTATMPCTWPDKRTELLAKPFELEVLAERVRTLLED